MWGWCKGKDEDDFGEGFDDREERHAFIRKVFIIVGCQLLLVFGICNLFIWIDEVKYFSMKYKWISFVCIAITAVILLAIGCFQRVRRSYPINIILLTVFTLAESYIIGSLCAHKYPIHVLLACGVTIAVCLALIIFALQARCDFTGIWPFLLVGSIILLIMGIVSIFIRDRIFLIVKCSFAVLLFSIYLVVDVQLMLGGKHKYVIDPEDYVLAAISIFVDIVTIFVYILQLIGLTWDE